MASSLAEAFFACVYESWIAADFAQQGEFGEDADLLGVEVGVRRLGERGA